MSAPTRDDSAESVERYIADALVIDPSAVREALDEGLRPEHFADPEAAALYRASVRCELDGHGADASALLEALLSHGGSRDRWVTRLSDVSIATTTAWVRLRARAVMRHAARRRMEHALRSALSKAPRSSHDVDAWLSVAADAVLAATLTDERRGPVGLCDAINAVAIAATSDVRPKTAPTLTPWPTVNRLSRGLVPGDLCVLAARPKVGKSALALSLALDVATRGRVLLFSMEMTAAEIAGRAIQSISPVPSEVLDGTRRATPDEEEMLSHAATASRDLLLTIDDRSEVTLSDIRARVRSEVSRGPLALVVVDYLGLLKLEKSETREQAVGEAAKQLKVMAKDARVPVLLVCALNRVAEGERPRMSHLRESGQIEYHATKIWFLHRAEEPNALSPNERQTLYLEAQRGAASGGEVSLIYTKSRCQHVEVADEPEPSRQFYPRVVEATGASLTWSPMRFPGEKSDDHGNDRSNGCSEGAAQCKGGVHMPRAQRGAAGEASGPSRADDRR